MSKWSWLLLRRVERKMMHRAQCLLQSDFKLKTALAKDKWTYMVILLTEKKGKRR